MKSMKECFGLLRYQENRLPMKILAQNRWRGGHQGGSGQSAPSNQIKLVNKGPFLKISHLIDPSKLLALTPPLSRNAEPDENWPSSTPAPTLQKWAESGSNYLVTEQLNFHSGSETGSWRCKYKAVPAPYSCP